MHVYLPVFLPASLHNAGVFSIYVYLYFLMFLQWLWLYYAIKLVLTETETLWVAENIWLKSIVTLNFRCGNGLYGCLEEIFLKCLKYFLIISEDKPYLESFQFIIKMIISFFNLCFFIWYQVSKKEAYICHCYTLILLKPDADALMDCQVQESSHGC